MVVVVQNKEEATLWSCMWVVAIIFCSQTYGNTLPLDRWWLLKTSSPIWTVYFGILMAASPSFPFILCSPFQVVTDDKYFPWLFLLCFIIFFFYNSNIFLHFFLHVRKYLWNLIQFVINFIAILSIKTIKGTKRFLGAFLQKEAKKIN